MAESFSELLSRHFDPAFIQSSPAVIYGLWPDLCLAYLNDGWFRFAAENGGEPLISRDWPVGRSIIEALPPLLKTFYADGFRACMEARQPWHHTYECSSAQLLRWFRMTAFPLESRRGLLVIHSLVVELTASAGNRTPHRAIEADYRNADELIRQCAYCRRVQRRCDGAWDWVPEWVQAIPLRTSHGICRPCREFHLAEDLYRLGGPGLREQS
jgi:hypothetical protein